MLHMLKIVFRGALGVLLSKREIEREHALEMALCSLSPCVVGHVGHVCGGCCVLSTVVDVLNFVPFSALF